MNSEGPEKVVYRHKDYNLRPERIKPFLHLQNALAKRELKLYPEMTEAQWVDAYSDLYRVFVDANPEFVDRFEAASKIENQKEKEEAIESIAEEVARRLVN